MIDTPDNTKFSTVSSEPTDPNLPDVTVHPDADEREGLEIVENMPTAEEIIDRFETIGLIGQDSIPLRETVLRNFAQKVGGRQLVVLGFLYAWELAKIDCLQEMPPVFGSLVDSDFIAVVKAIASPDFAQTAIQSRARIVAGVTSD